MAVLALQLIECSLSGILGIGAELDEFPHSPSVTILPSVGSDKYQLS